MKSLCACNDFLLFHTKLIGSNHKEAEGVKHCQNYDKLKIFYTWLCIPGKKGRRKSKALTKREDKERRLKERQRRQEQLENEKDETSSTTTESSSLEADEKVLIDLFCFIFLNRICTHMVKSLQ